MGGLWVQLRAAMTNVRLENINKRFGKAVALADISVEIGAGELFFLLGPSGCGKTTLLRLIAGLGEPDSGRIFFNDEDVTKLATQERNAVMCFQSYALWPHMTVRDNIRFGLEVRKASEEERKRRVELVLKLVQMEELAGRRPNELSGGQQQRVALARALAVGPRCLLLDEPLSNLDAKLREEMRGEIRRICKAAGFTTIYVTHDQKEALSIADRIGLIKDGRLVQVGTPGELYHKPKTSFVADFIGRTNLLRGQVIGRSGEAIHVQTAAGTVTAACREATGDSVMLSIRPEQMRMARANAGGDGRNRFVGKPLESTFLGEASEHVVLVNDHRLRVIFTPPLFNVPEELAVEFDPEDVVVLTE